MLTPEVHGLAETLSGLQDIHAFRARMEEYTDSTAGEIMLYVLAGRRDANWMGLLGLGVWSDD